MSQHNQSSTVPGAQPGGAELPGFLQTAIANTESFTDWTRVDTRGQFSAFSRLVFSRPVLLQGTNSSLCLKQQQYTLTTPTPHHMWDVATLRVHPETTGAADRYPLVIANQHNLPYYRIVRSADSTAVVPELTNLQSARMSDPRLKQLIDIALREAMAKEGMSEQAWSRVVSEADLTLPPLRNISGE